MFKKTFAVTIFLFLIANLSYGQVGITSATFLQIAPDSRATGMGNTGVAIADNASAIYWNPAGLGFQKGNQVFFTHSKYLQNINAGLSYEYLVGKTHFDNIGTFGANITYLNLGDQINTDESGQKLGKFTSNQYDVVVSYGRKLSDYWSIGTGVKFIHSKLTNNNSSSTIAFDLAGQYKAKKFSAGINLSNIGPGMNYSNDEDSYKSPLPTTLRIGWSYTVNLDENGINTLTIANDYSKIMARTDSSGKPDGPFKALFTSWDSITRTINTNEGPTSVSLPQQIRIGTGLEYWYNNLFALRAGYHYENPKNDRQFLTLGAGLKYKSFIFNFSYINTLGNQDSPLANTTRYGLGINF